MRITLSLLCLGFALTFTTTTSAADRITLYQHAHYKGRAVKLQKDVPNLSSYKFDNIVSSLKVEGSRPWQVCKDPNYKGKCVTVKAGKMDIKKIRKLIGNDVISSVRRFSAPNKIILYQHAGYKGRAVPLEKDVPNLSSYKFDNTVSSLKVEGNQLWQVCKDPNYKGKCVTVKAGKMNIKKIRKLIGNDVISSVRRLPAPEPIKTASKIRLYQHAHYKGRSVLLEKDVPNLSSYKFDNIVSSLKIEGRQSWQVCKDRNYKGKCVTVKAGKMDIGKIRKLIGNDVISSVRRLPAAPEPRDGGWGDWKATGDCSKECGGGKQRYVRVCDNPAPAHGGKACAGASTKEEDCNTQCCPVDGGFSDWQPVGDCSQACGGGVQTLVRECNSPAPSCNGRQCSGPTTKEEECNTQCCPVDGVFSDWRPVGECSQACGGGKQTFVRECNSPAPACDGQDCIGLSTKEEDCNIQACPPVIEEIQEEPAPSNPCGEDLYKEGPHGSACLQLLWLEAGCKREGTFFPDTPGKGAYNWWNKQTVAGALEDMRWYKRHADSAISSGNTGTQKYIGFCYGQ